MVVSELFHFENGQQDGRRKEQYGGNRSSGCSPLRPFMISRNIHDALTTGAQGALVGPERMHLMDETTTVAGFV